MENGGAARSHFNYVHGVIVSGGHICVQLFTKFSLREDLVEGSVNRLPSFHEIASLIKEYL